ncbi:SH3 domain-containing protein [Streptomyces sp. NPDC047017]|uniref:SH3 domain-containing protein n=1 Tax=Streptomyces sp. NPDC047017 TaxID=3155024 RepID=UPI0033FC7C80
MPLRSPLPRLALTAAAGTLLATAAIAPAVAADGRGATPAPTPTTTAQPPTTTAQTPAPGTTAAPQTSATSTPAPDESTRFYRGRVTARGGLALRPRPDRGSRVLRVARQGEVVWIYCKTNGGEVQGNHLWYLLADGTWAWGSARYIDTIGPSPRWC